MIVSRNPAMRIGGEQHKHSSVVMVSQLASKAFFKYVCSSTTICRATYAVSESHQCQSLSRDFSVAVEKEPTGGVCYIWTRLDFIYVGRMRIIYTGKKNGERMNMSIHKWIWVCKELIKGIVSVIYKHGFGTVPDVNKDSSGENHGKTAPLPYCAKETLDEPSHLTTHSGLLFVR